MHQQGEFVGKNSVFLYEEQNLKRVLFLQCKYGPISSGLFTIRVKHGVGAL